MAPVAVVQYVMSPLERAKLFLCRADFVVILVRVLTRFTAETGERCYVERGYASISEQSATYADSLVQGFRASPPNLSRHPLGVAADIRIVGHSHDDAAIDQRDPLYKKLADIAQQEGLTAGYYFSNASTKPDPYHLEFKEPLADSQAKWAALTKGRLWRALGIGVVAAGLITLAVRAQRRRRRRRHA